VNAEAGMPVAAAEGSYVGETSGRMPKPSFVYPSVLQEMPINFIV
jgi:hypothetical protein